jgi:hypothetical protein
MKIYTLVAARFLFTAAYSQIDYDRHIAFDNSISSKSFYYSHGSSIAPSELELVNGRFTVESNHSVTPPNSLRLKWRSRTGGGWLMELQVNTRYGMPEFNGSNLYAWCYSEEGLSANASPRIYLADSAGQGTPTITLLGSVENLPARKWTRVRLPLDSFHGLVNDTKDPTFDAHKLARIALVQGLDDGQEHTLYLDDIEVGDDPPEGTHAPDAPSGLAGKGSDRHVDLSWAPMADALLQYYKIYRSTEGKPFTAIGIQRADRTRYEDFLGASGKSASYKITAVDVSGNESPTSATVQAATHELSDDELLTMVGSLHCFRTLRG